jgi:predicted dehydrogenase
MTQLGVGMIGYGFMGKMHSYAYASLPFIYHPLPFRIKLVGACAPSEASRALALDSAAYEFATPDYNELLERPDIHVINVCTPNYLHKEQAIAAIRAGKHVYCDKPLALTGADAQEMAHLARESGLTCQVTFHNRFCPALQRARQLVEDGFLGDVLSFRAVYLHTGYTDPKRPISWKMKRETSGAGALLDLGTHIIDIVRWLAGDFGKVNARFRTLIKERPAHAGSDELVPVTVDDVAMMQVELPNGALGSIEVSRIATGTTDDLRFEINGSRGAIAFNLMDANWLSVYDDRKPGGTYGGERGWQRIETIQDYPKPAVLPGGKAPVGWMRFHIASLYSFVSNVIELRPGYPSFDDGLAVQRICDAAIVSHESGSWEPIAKAGKPER